MPSGFRRYQTHQSSDQNHSASVQIAVEFTERFVGCYIVLYVLVNRSSFTCASTPRLCGRRDWGGGWGARKLREESERLGRGGGNACQEEEGTPAARMCQPKA